MGKKCVPSVLTRPRAPPAKAVKAVFEGEEDEEMKEEDASSERRRRELLPLGIHRRKVSSVRVRGLFCVRILILFFPRRTLVSFLFISTKRLNFLFSKTKILLLYYTRERTSSLCDDAFKEQQQQQQQQQHATTTKESTSEKSGEREDGFEGTRERRTGVRVFEDS